MTAPSTVLSRSETRPCALFDVTSMQRMLFGSFLLFHGLAHAGIGVWAGETGRWWIVTLLCGGSSAW